MSVALTLALVLGVIFSIDIRPADGPPDTPAQQPAGRVTLSVRCDTVAGLAADGTTPADGVILPRTEMPLYDGDTVYDVLQRAGLRIDHRGGKTDAYVAGINDLREQQYGDLSGWMFFVNGKSPSVGCGSYVLRDADVVEWLYSVRMGEDLPPKGEEE